MDSKVLVIVGAGPGIGASLAHRYGREGYAVGLVARSVEGLERLGHRLQQSGITAGWSQADITDAAALTAAVTRLGEHRGRIDTLHFNPSRYRAADPLHLSVDELLEDVHLGCGALLTAVQAARPFMRSGARITVTGSVAADRPSPQACSLGVQKAALRNLVLSLDRTLAPDGIRATSLTVHGVLSPDTAFSPDRVAAALYDAALTPEDTWRAEVAYTG